MLRLLPPPSVTRERRQDDAIQYGWKMKQDLCQHVTHLKSALLSLPPTGETGFEGLIGTTLREISGVPFRLARSGSQHGVDGKSAYERDAICFEGKRYDGKVPKAKVLSKIAELSMHNTQTDIWVLGATSQIASQLADDARGLGTKNGIHVLILDWSDTDLPPLVVALAMGGTRVEGFLENNIDDTTEFCKAKAALDAVRNSQGFFSHASRISAECNAPSVGLALAQRANTEWLCAAFSSRRAARIQFGQPLAPGETETASVRRRKTLIEQLNPYLTTPHDETVLFVLGGEGYGKSWVVAQSWLSLAEKPLMLFLTPNDFAVADRQFYAADFLVENIIRQTGNAATAVTRERWFRRMRQWQVAPETDDPRLIVVIDGINQRPKTDWARIIESIGNELNQLGGCLIVTSRSPYFRDHVRGRLSVCFTEIHVPEWSESERDEILRGHNIKGSDLYPDVATLLSNPRLLGIALECLNEADISSFKELTVPRLLFEHMRMSERDAPKPQPALAFARKLQEYAQESISRVKAGQEDDLAVVDDIQAVADGRFCQTVDGDPTRCSLNDEGLTLALGFFVIYRLQAAHRNGRDLADELNAILDPIASLDDTADVVLAALTVATLDNRFGQDKTVVALIEGFALLQNPNQANFPAFAGLARRRSQSFMDGAQSLCLSGSYQPNFDWIREALIEASTDAGRWQLMAAEVHSWLSVYSLSTVWSKPSNPHYIEAHADHYLQQRKAVEKNVESLSANEREILKTMIEEESPTWKLSQLALSLLAGKPLATFAQSLVKWRFSVELNPANGTPHNEFGHLVSLNRIDWEQTRKELLKVSSPLRKADISKSGKRTLMSILRATGHSDDAHEAETLVKDLTKGRPQIEGWRRVETYCAADPCDPASDKPENVAHTARQYGEIDVSNVSIAMGSTSEDHFFSMARPGIARFEPGVAIAKHRELVADVLHRTGFPLRQGLFELRKHTALLTEADARALLKRRSQFSTTHAKDVLSKEDAWIVSQYHLLLAFSFLSAKEQAAILLASEKDERFLLDLFRIAKPLSEKNFESLLETACVEDDERGQYLLLQLACYTSAPLSTGVRKRVAALFRSESGRVRTFALSVIAQSGDKELLNKVVESNWMATDSKTETYWETWFGSMALLEAASQGLIVHEGAVDRISAHMYGRAAAMLNADAAHDIACRIDASISHVLDLDGDLVAPDIRLQVDPSRPCEPDLFTVNERLSGAQDLARQMSSLLEDDEAFEERQRRSHDAFREFEANLTRAEARIILDDLGLEGFAAVVTAAGKLADRWHGLFMNIPDDKLPSIHNLILWLAHSLARKDPKKAKMLFRRIRSCKPVVQVTFGRAGVQLDAMASWAGVSNPVLDDLRFARLDQANTDHQLALEVLAALLNSNQDLLTTYIKAKLSKQEPAEVARGMMVAGFSDQSEFNERVLERYQGSAGLIGDAQEAAEYAYERNIWARHWFEKMCRTETNLDFWRWSVLFLKIVDGRFDVWHSDYARKGSPIQSFGFAVDSMLKNCFTRWERHRNNKLFGSEAPATIFLKGEDINN